MLPPDPHINLIPRTREHAIVEQVVHWLVEFPEVFVFAGTLARVLQDEPHVHAFCVHGLREVISKYVRFSKRNRSGSWTACRCPDWIPRDVLARGEWPGVRRVDTFAHAPFLTPDGEIVDAAGYHVPTRTFLLRTLSLTVPTRPTRDDARRALTLLADLLGDFPFVDGAGRAAALAQVLTLAGRTSFEGPAPAFLVWSSTPGSGKSLLVDVATTIAVGRTATRSAFTADDNEMRKRITALLMAGSTHVLLDNLGQRLASPSLEALLTGQGWTDRVLGESRMLIAPSRISWAITGNSPSTGPDIARRIVPIHLDAGVERPDARSGFRHPDILAHVREERAALLGAALTVLSAFIRAGRPRQALEPFGSFEGWDRTVRHALVWAGADDPCRHRAVFADEHDESREVLGDVFDFLTGCAPMTAVDFMEHAPMWLLQRVADGPRPHTNEVARALGRLVDRIVDSKVLRRRKRARGFEYWVEPA